MKRSQQVGLVNDRCQMNRVNKDLESFDTSRFEDVDDWKIWKHFVEVAKGFHGL